MAARKMLAPFEVSIDQEMLALWACMDTASGPEIHIALPEEG